MRGGVKVAGSGRFAAAGLAGTLVLVALGLALCRGPLASWAMGLSTGQALRQQQSFPPGEVAAEATEATTRTAPAPAVARNCTSNTLRLVTDDFGGVVARRPPAGTGAGRVAVCFTGQLRALPLAYLSWHSGGLLNVMQSGGAALDLFAVVSLSESHIAWRPLLDSLEPVRTVELHGHIIVDKPLSPWAYREDGTGAALVVMFNLARLPTYSDGKHGSSLLQHWSMHKCRQIVKEEEYRLGAHYLRVARLRTDVVIAPVFFKSNSLVERRQWMPGQDYSRYPHSTTFEDSKFYKYLKCKQKTTGANGNSSVEDSEECDEAFEQEIELRRQACSKYLVQAALSGVDWYLGSDLHLIGSRDLILDGMFMGLDTLVELRNTSRFEIKTWTLGLWGFVTERARRVFQGRGKPWAVGGGPCLPAFGLAELVRVAGPPVQAFYVEHVEHLQASCEQVLPRRQCVRELARLFHLRLDVCCNCTLLEYRGAEELKSKFGFEMGDSVLPHKVTNSGGRSFDGFKGNSTAKLSCMA